MRTIEMRPEFNTHRIHVRTEQGNVNFPATTSLDFPEKIVLILEEEGWVCDDAGCEFEGFGLEVVRGHYSFNVDIVLTPEEVLTCIKKEMRWLRSLEDVSESLLT